jgi:hypothetical protein
MSKIEGNKIEEERASCRVIAVLAGVGSGTSVSTVCAGMKNEPGDEYSFTCHTERIQCSGIGTLNYDNFGRRPRGVHECFPQG